MASLITERERRELQSRVLPRSGLLHDFGSGPLPECRWVTQPLPVGDPDGTGGEHARLSGMLRLGPMSFYVELIEVGYTADGCQEFVAEQGAAPDECERTYGPDIHRAIGGSAETFLWKGREYALVVMPYTA